MRTLAIVDAMDLAAAYAAARYGVRADAGTFALQVGHPAPELEACWPARSYAFITAWNPASDPRPDEANHAADLLLTAQLDALGVERMPAWAESPDGRWHEPGWLLAQIDDVAVNELGATFGQIAILVWDAGEPVTVRMLMPDPFIDAGPTALRRVSAELAACIQWSSEQRESALNA